MEIEETLKLSNQFLNKMMNEYFEPKIEESEVEIQTNEQNYDFIDGLMKKSDEEKKQIQKHVIYII